ncbi:MAG: hypothetical protein LKE53_06470 [Oscillospiraceae bacterium]|nr:hypothetical protein [Oscillospiraceae bacterium]
MNAFKVVLEMAAKEYLEKIRNGAAVRQVRMYRVVVFVIVIAMTVFCTSKLWMPDTSAPVNSEIGTKISTSNAVSLTLKSWIYNPDTNYMEASFTIDTDNYTSRQGLQFNTKLYSDNSQTMPLNCTVAYNDTDSLIFQIRDLPPGWKILSLRVGDSTQNLSNANIGTAIVDSSDSIDISSDKTISSNTNQTPAWFNCDARKVTINSALKPKDKMTYAMDSISLNIADEQKIISLLNAKTQQYKSTKNALESDIASIKKEEFYQTDSEIQESRNNIQDKESQIKNLDTNCTDSEKQIALCQEKISKLQLKLSDLKHGITRSYVDSDADFQSSSAVSAAPSSSSSHPTSSKAVSSTMSKPASSKPASKPATPKK